MTYHIACQMMIELAEIGLPQLDAAVELPRIPPEEYEGRIRALRDAVDSEWVAIYGDREHVGNLAFVCGFDPRFEEALLLLGRDGRRILIVGTEGIGHSQGVSIDLERVHVPTFSLMGIDRSQGSALADALAACGVGSGHTVGLVGWKSLEPSEWTAAAPGLVAPAFLADALRDAVGDTGRVVDVTDVLMAVDGLRLRNSADQLAVFEWGASRSSACVLEIIGNAEAGVSELALFSAMTYCGEPMLYHPILTSGEDIPLGLRSPTGRVVGKGDPIFTTIGMWGGNCGRGGILGGGDSDSHADNPDFLGRVAIPYWRTIVAWWENVRIGARGSDLHEMLAGLCAEQGFKPILNTGHQQDWEDWPNTPFRGGTDARIASGMTLAVDIFSASNSPSQMIHCEDTVAVADDDLRAELAERHPAVWARIRARQDFVREELGVQAPDELLPLTTTPAYLPPYWLAPSLALRATG